MDAWISACNIADQLELQLWGCGFLSCPLSSWLFSSYSSISRMLLLLLLFVIVIIIIIIVIIVIIIIIFTFGNHSYLISSCSKKMSWSESSYSDCITVLNAYKVNNKLLLPLNCPSINQIISCLVWSESCHWVPDEAYFLNLHNLGLQFSATYM